MASAGGLAIPTAAERPAGATVNPYPGLRPFETEESELFFGRDNEIYDLLRKLRTLHFLAVLGPSGCGKSSLVKAGVLAAIESGYMAEKASWEVVSLRPGAGPLESLWKAVSPYLRSEATSESFFEEPPVLRGKDPAAPILLFVDQFEELFDYVHGEQGEAEGQAFVRWIISAAANPGLEIYVMITMRSEFLGSCADYPGLAEAINEGMYLVPRMTREQMRAAIVGPATAVGGAITASLVDRLLNEAEKEPDALPVLQHALMRMWAKRVGDEPLGLPAYEAAGGLSKLLNDHAESAYKQLSPAEQKIAEALFRTITQIFRGRRIRRRSKFEIIVARAHSPAQDVARVVKAFASERFLFTSDSKPKPDTEVDLEHEALMRNWDRLRQWMDDEARVVEVQQNVETQAAKWAGQDRPADYLYRGVQLAEADRLVGSRLEELSKDTQAFLKVSRRRSQRRRLTQRLALLGLFVVLAGMGANFWVRHAVGNSKREFSMRQQIANEKAQQNAEQLAVEAVNASKGNIAAGNQTQTRQLVQSLLAVQFGSSASTKSELPAACPKVAGRVFVQIRSEGQSAEAEEVQKKLTPQCFSVHQWQLLGVGPEKKELRYFVVDDEKEANSVANAIGQLLDSPEKVPVRYVEGYPNVVPGQLEFWFGAKPEWCYQERHPNEPPPRQYAVYCHWSKDNCERAKSGSKTATGCAFLPDLKKSNWNTQGLFHSWYQEAHAEPLPLPFPQFPDSQPLLK